MSERIDRDVARSVAWGAAYDKGTRQISTKDVYLIADAVSALWEAENEQLREVIRRARSGLLCQVIDVTQEHVYLVNTAITACDEALQTEAKP